MKNDDGQDPRAGRNSLEALRRASIAAATLALAACASATVPMPAAVAVSAGDPLSTPARTPPRTSIAIVRREWHTDVCLRTSDANAWVMSLARGFDGASVLCFGYGERQYVVERRHDPLTMLGALLPSRAALLMTVLRASPQAAFGAQNVVEASVTEAGLDGLQQFLRASVQTNAGKPLRLGEGPYAGSVFFAATGTYDAFHTCNTWTARALRSAGLPTGDVLFAGSLMREAGKAAAATPPVDGSGTH